MACDRKECHCTEADYEENGKSYCSETCAQRSSADSGAPGACPCGHPDCAAI